MTQHATEELKALHRRILLYDPRTVWERMAEAEEWGVPLELSPQDIRCVLLKLRDLGSMAAELSRCAEELPE